MASRSCTFSLVRVVVVPVQETLGKTFLAGLDERQAVVTKSVPINPLGLHSKERSILLLNAL